MDDNLGGPADHDVQQHWRLCHRLWLWPIQGEVQEEMYVSLEDFILNQLRILRSAVKKDDVADVRRVRMARGRTIRHEVIVQFVDIETRDRVASYVWNLAEFVDKANLPTAGVRHDVPGFLGGVLRP